VLLSVAPSKRFVIPRRLNGRFTRCDGKIEFSICRRRRTRVLHPRRFGRVHGDDISRRCRKIGKKPYPPFVFRDALYPKYRAIVRRLYFDNCARANTLIVVVRSFGPKTNITRIAPSASIARFVMYSFFAFSVKSVSRRNALLHCRSTRKYSRAAVRKTFVRKTERAPPVVENVD